MVAILRKVPLVFLALGAFVILASAAAVGTISVATVSRSLAIMGETVEADLNTEIRPDGISKAGTNQSALGTTCATAVEATTGLASVRTSVVKNDWVYGAEVKEASVNSWAVGNYYRLEVYAGGVLQSTLYAQNANDNSQNSVEGVAITVDLGIAGANPVLPDSYNIVVTSLGATCV